MNKIKKKKKGLSAVVATILLVLLTTVAVTIVWVFVNNVVRERTQGVQSCFDIESSEKLTINDYYTCFNSSLGEVQFSINVGDVEIDSVVVSILAQGTSKSFTLTNNATVISGLRPYRGLIGEPVKAPGKNEGLTYIASGFSGQIDWIKIAPVVEDRQCDASDTLLEIEDCSLLVN